MRLLSSGVVRLLRRWLSASSCVAVLFAAWSAGCDDDEPQPGCCAMAPVCPEGSQEVSACETGDCFTVSACCTTVICQPQLECMPLCPPGEVQADLCDGSNETCHEEQQCDSLFHCEYPPLCTAVPSCDEGDDEQPDQTCPGGEACYQVEICGFTMFCVDHGQPHGCPETPPVENEPCPVVVTCEYPIDGRDCVETWVCQEPFKAQAPIPDGVLNHWHLAESTCEGGAGGGSAGGGGAGGAG